VNRFDCWRNRIYWYIENSEFGIKWAAIYDNKNANREKEPILTIAGNGLEYLQTIHLVLFKIKCTISQHLFYTLIGSCPKVALQG
jgi:hypothetical protein